MSSTFRILQEINDAKDKGYIIMEARPIPAQGYPDLDEHLDRLEIEGSLIRIKETVDKDQEMPPLVRRQFRGGIKKKDPKAFLFEKPVLAEGKAYQDVRHVHDPARQYSYTTDATVAGLSYVSARIRIVEDYQIEPYGSTLLCVL